MRSSNSARRVVGHSQSRQIGAFVGAVLDAIDATWHVGMTEPAADALARFRAFNFDLGKRAPVTFDTLFKPGAKPLEVLNPIVRRELGAPAAHLDANVYQNFAITADAVLFFFGKD